MPRAAVAEEFSGNTDRQVLRITRAYADYVIAKANNCDSTAISYCAMLATNIQMNRHYVPDGHTKAEKALEGFTMDSYILRRPVDNGHA